MFLTELCPGVFTFPHCLAASSSPLSLVLAEIPLAGWPHFAHLLHSTFALLPLLSFAPSTSSWLVQPWLAEPFHMQIHKRRKQATAVVYQLQTGIVHVAYWSRPFYLQSIYLKLLACCFDGGWCVQACATSRNTLHHVWVGLRNRALWRKAPVCGTLLNSQELSVLCLWFMAEL